MPLDKQFRLNTEDGMCEIDIYVDDVLITTYYFQDSTVCEVTLSERLTSSTLTIQNLNDNISSLFKWIQLIESAFIIPYQTRSKYTAKLKKKNNGITATFDDEGANVTQAEFDRSTGLITFDPRVETTMNFKDFKAWAHFLSQFVEEAKTF